MNLNKRGESEKNPLPYSVIYILLFLIFLAPIFIFVNSQRDGAALWEDFDAKEIVRMIDLAEPGTEAWIDVTESIKVSRKNKISDKDAFKFNNVDNELVVRLRQQGATGFKFFNDVDIVNWTIIDDKIMEDGKEKIISKLYFKIVEVQK